MGACKVKSLEKLDEYSGKLQACKRALRSAEEKNLDHAQVIEKQANWMREAVEEPGLPEEMKKRGAIMLKNLERM